MLAKFIFSKILTSLSEWFAIVDNNAGCEKVHLLFSWSFGNMWNHTENVDGQHKILAGIVQNGKQLWLHNWKRLEKVLPWKQAKRRWLLHLQRHQNNCLACYNCVQPVGDWESFTVFCLTIPLVTGQFLVSDFNVSVSLWEYITQYMVVQWMSGSLRV